LNTGDDRYCIKLFSSQIDFSSSRKAIPVVRSPEDVATQKFTAKQVLNNESGHGALSDSRVEITIPD
jgi:hypothetical protein